MRRSEGGPLEPAVILPPPPSTSSLVRIRGEGVIEHRALLLYALGGEKRSVRGTARAMRKSEATVRGWSKRYEWERRVLETPDPDVEAYLIYQREYLHTVGIHCIVRLTQELVEPMGFLAQIDRAMLERDEAAAIEDARVNPRPPPEFDTRSRQGITGRPPTIIPARDRIPAMADIPPPQQSYRVPTGPRAPDPEMTGRVLASLGIGGEGEAVRGEVVAPGTSAQARAPAPPAGPTPEERAQLALDRDLKLLDGALGYCAQALKDGKVPVTLQGIATLLKTKRLLLGQSTANVAVAIQQTTSAAPVPTVRVQQAGGDEAAVLAAYREDVADIAAILDGIAAGKERDTMVVTTGEERKQA